jgi:hypothetical protein
MELFNSSVVEKYVYQYGIIPAIQILSFIKKTLCPDPPLAPSETIDILQGTITLKNGKEIAISDESLDNVSKNDRIVDIIKNDCKVNDVKSVYIELIDKEGDYISNTYVIDVDPDVRI